MTTTKKSAGAPAVSSENVQKAVAAAERIAASGRKPTVHGVREAARVSMAAAQEGMTRWRASDDSSQAAPPPPSIVKARMDLVWKTAWIEASSAWDTDRDALHQRIDQTDEALQNARARADRLADDKVELAHQRDEAIDRAKEAATAAAAAKEQHAATIADLRAQLAAATARADAATATNAQLQTIIDRLTPTT